MLDARYMPLRIVSPHCSPAVLVRTGAVRINTLRHFACALSPLDLSLRFCQLYRVKEPQRHRAPGRDAANCTELNVL